MTEPKKPGDEAPEDHDRTDADRPEQDGLPTDESPEASHAEETAGEKAADANDDTAGSDEAGARKTDGDGEEAAGALTGLEDVSGETPETADRETGEEDRTDGALPEGDSANAGDADPDLTEEERREIAEAALRDAETGYVAAGTGAADTGDAPSDTPHREEDGERAQSAEASAVPLGAAAGGAAAASATGSGKASPQREVVVEKRGGVLAGFVGGVIAIGAAAIALPYVLPEDMRPVTSLAPVEESISAQTARIDEVSVGVGGLSSRIDSLEAELSQTVGADDLAALEDRIADIRSELSAQSDSLGARIEDVAAQLSRLERNPVESATDPAIVGALANYAREVEQLRAEMEAQSEKNAQLIQQAAEATAEARAAAEAEQRAAEERAAEAARRQALANITSALEAGEPFADDLDMLGTDVPAALSNMASSGVPTLAALQASFSAPARDALDAARRANVGDEPAERGLSFLQTQLGIRSLAPREGDSADAILSRAEAATRNGDLSAALAELQALPDPAKAEMADWMSRASARAEATAAADALAQSLATN